MSHVSSSDLDGSDVRDTDEGGTLSTVLDTKSLIFYEDITSLTRHVNIPYTTTVRRSLLEGVKTKVTSQN